MSMTREEAIEELERLLRHWDDLENDKRCFRGYDQEAVTLALTALRPVSREQMEKVWPGCEACKDASLAIGEVWLYGTFEGHIDVSGNLHYCPNCGRPITPVAKERQRERLEALKDES